MYYSYDKYLMMPLELIYGPDLAYYKVHNTETNETLITILGTDLHKLTRKHEARVYEDAKRTVAPSNLWEEYFEPKKLQGIDDNRIRDIRTIVAFQILAERDERLETIEKDQAKIKHLQIQVKENKARVKELNGEPEEETCK